VERVEVVELVAGWEGVQASTPGPGSDAPEIAWGDTFFSYAPDGVPASAQPFATIVTKDYPDDASAQLDRPGVFRVNVAAGRDAARAVAGATSDDDDPTELDRLRLHPVYGSLGWVAVANPGPRTAETLRTLLRDAYEAARTRAERRDRAR